MTPEELTQLWTRFDGLSEAAQRHVFLTLLGSHDAINLFTGRGDTFAELSGLLGRVELEHPLST